MQCPPFFSREKRDFFVSLCLSVTCDAEGPPPCECLCQVQGWNAFGPGKQYKYHLCAGSRGGNISFGLLRVAILVFLYGGSHYTWGLPFCFAALQLYYGYTDIGLLWISTSTA